MTLQDDAITNIAHDLHRIFDSSSTDSSIDTFCDHCVELLGVDGMAVSLIGPGQRELLGCSSPEVGAIEQWQFTFDEGPALSAYTCREPVAFVLSDPLASPWPRTAVLVREAGWEVVAGLPLMVGSRAVGAMDLYSTDERILGQDALSDASSVCRAVARALPPRERTGSSTAYSRLPPDVVYRACRLEAERLGVSVAEAILELRIRSRAEHRTLVAVAQEILATNPE